MKTVLPFSEKFLSLLVCPSCGSGILCKNDHFCCTNATCNGMFPILHGIPFLIDEHKSRISVKSITSYRPDTSASKRGLKQFVKKVTPGRSLNFTSEKNYAKLVERLETDFDSPQVLIIGGAGLGRGIQPLIVSPRISLLETDVYIGPRTQLLCDGQMLPFRNQSFQAVVVQAVLEFILDIDRCVEEIHRVLVDKGYVYSEMPFMQQAQGFPDLRRLTNLGHRYLFRHFRELDSGAVAGTGTALYWAWEFFVCSFSDHPVFQSTLRRVARFSGFWLKYFDFLVIKKKASLEGASANYFLGQKCYDFSDGSRFSFKKGEGGDD